MEFLNEIQRSDRELYFDQPEFLQAWVAQIEKDMNADLHVDPKVRTDIPIAIKALETALRERFGDGEADLPQLLYKIDLDEGLLHHEMHSNRWESWFQMLAHKIAEREAKKVIFRWRFSSGA